MSIISKSNKLNPKINFLDMKLDEEEEETQCTKY